MLLALGDSLAAGYQPTDGQAPPPRDPSTGEPDQGYPGGYAADLAKAEHLRLLDLACPGETTTSFVGVPAEAACGDFYRSVLGAGSQEAAALAELARLRGQVRLVTFDLGANDVDSCLKRGSVSESCILQRLAAVSRALPPILARLRAALAREDPGARMAGMDYYDPFLGLAEHPGGPEGTALASLSLIGMEALDASLRTDYRRAGMAVADVSGEFQSASATPVTLYGGKRLPRDAAIVCRWTWMCPLPGSPVRSPDIHPNDLGYARIALAFERALAAS